MHTGPPSLEAFAALHIRASSVHTRNDSMFIEEGQATAAPGWMSNWQIIGVGFGQTNVISHPHLISASVPLFAAPQTSFGGTSLSIAIQTRFHRDAFLAIALVLQSVLKAAAAVGEVAGYLERPAIE